MKKIKILITGCGGDIGQSIGKIIQELPLCDKSYGIDMHDDHPGKFIFDNCWKISPVTNESYLQELQEIIKKNAIDIIIPTSEPELKFFLSKNIKDISGVPLIMPNARSMEIGFDKLSTALFLKNEQLPYPETIILKEVKDKKLPCIVKDRNGSGSKAVIKVSDEKDFNFYAERYPEYICQEYLVPDDQEYTCGLYRTENKEIRTIIIKRKLIGDSTGVGLIVKDQVIDELLNKIAERLDLSGSINVQLRLTQKGPFIFEINPRFSSTVYFRHLIGFKDLLWSIEEKLKITSTPYSPPKAGIKFYKGIKEYIIN